MTDIDLDNSESEKAVVAILLVAAAQQIANEAPAAALEPVGDIDDLHALFEKQRQLANERKVFKTQEAELLASLQRIREQSADLEQQVESVKTKAAQLFETLFGRPERPAPQVEQPESTPRAAGPVPSRKPDNSIVFDRSSPAVSATPQNAPAEVDAVRKFGFSF